MSSLVGLMAAPELAFLGAGVLVVAVAMAGLVAIGVRRR
jgi:hypothetical protein